MGRRAPLHILPHLPYRCRLGAEGNVVLGHHNLIEQHGNDYATLERKAKDLESRHDPGRRRTTSQFTQPDRSARRKDDFTIRRWKGAIPAI